MRHLGHDAAALAIAFRITLSAEHATQAVRRGLRDAAPDQHAAGQAAVDSHGCLGDQRAGPHAVRPGLAAITRFDAEHFRDAIDILAAGAAAMDDQSVDIVLAKPGLLERARERLGQETHARAAGLFDKAGAAYADDCGLRSKAGHACSL